MIPWWGVVLILAGVIGMLVLISVRANQQIGTRARAVSRAATQAAQHDPDLAASRVQQIAEELYREARTAWEARDAERLAQIMEPDVLEQFARGMNRHHHHVILRSVRRVQYVGLVNRGDERRVVVYIVARVRDYVEAADVHHKQDSAVATARVLSEYWTLVKRDGRWLVAGIEDLNAGKHHLTEPIVATPGGATSASGG
jgi:predicted lipid-binding transport protein (Tim44 family)